jgi:hypothetical protein
MSALRDSTGLIVLPGSAVLIGILVLCATSLLRAAPRRGPAAKVIAEAAARAPTDVHMTLIVAGKMIGPLVRRWTSRNGG